MSEDLEVVQSIETMADLGRELRRRRITAGFKSLPELLKSAKRELPRSTAYTLEEGLRKSNWASVEAYLRACGATDSEIDVWREAHDRAFQNYGDRVTANPKVGKIPTAKQLAEMGSEEAADILSSIGTSKAADLLRRVEVKVAAELLPEISLSAVVQILPEVGQARATLLFENINLERGAELLAEMASEDALRLLDDLDTSRAAGLIAGMPRGRAAKILREIPVDRAARMLTEIPSNKAAKLLGELGFDFLVAMVSTERSSKVPGVLDYVEPELVAELLTRSIAEEKALTLLAKMTPHAAAGVLQRMDSEVARRWITQITAERMSALITAFALERQVEILSSQLDVAQAAQVLGLAVFDCVSYLLRDLGADRLSSIVMEMGIHEQVLVLALMRPADRKRLLGKLPESLAVDLTREVGSLPSLANHVAEIDAERALFYLTEEMEEISGELLSLMDPHAAARIIGAAGDYDISATILDSVEAGQVARILESMDTWEIAHVLQKMRPDHAVSALVKLDVAFAERVLIKIDENVNMKTWQEEKLSPSEFEKVRSERRKAATYMREQLSRVRGSQ